MRPPVLAALKRWLLRRALARASAELGRVVRHDDDWLHEIGLAGPDIAALGDELRVLAGENDRGKQTRFRYGCSQVPPG
jgi:hypothetical protein